MRLFECVNAYPAYFLHFCELSRNDATFVGKTRRLLADRSDAAHILLPCLNGDPQAFLTDCGNRELQRLWAREQGMSSSASEDDILRAQIEAHRTEIFYDMGPSMHGEMFVHKLPGCVKRTIAWWSGPSPGPALVNYDLVVCNFPGRLRELAELGCKTAYFSPAHDPVMNEYAANENRPIDVLFVGTYSRHHVWRNELLQGIATLTDRYNVVLHLYNSRLTTLSESLLGRVLPLGKHRRSKEIRAIACGPIFGRDYYRALSRSKITINCTGEIAGADRGTMRCFEAMGCASLLLSNDGIYPNGMESDKTLVTYTTMLDVSENIHLLLSDEDRRRRIARAGFEMVSCDYSKERQWARFQELV